MSEGGRCGGERGMWSRRERGAGGAGSRWSEEGDGRKEMQTLRGQQSTTRSWTSSWGGCKRTFLRDSTTRLCEWRRWRRRGTAEVCCSSQAEQAQVGGEE
eukprot:179354-Hanusia_phi.AAC.1